MASKYQEKLARAEAEANRRANEARKSGVSGRPVHPETYDSWGFNARDSFAPVIARQPDPLFKPLIKRDMFDPTKHTGHTLAGFTLITESYMGPASKDRSLGNVTIPMPKSTALHQAPCFLVARVITALDQDLRWEISRVVSKKSAKGNVHEDVYTLPVRFGGTVSQMADVLAGWCKNVSGYPKSHQDHDKYPKAVVVTSRTQGTPTVIPPMPEGL